MFRAHFLTLFLLSAASLTSSTQTIDTLNIESAPDAIVGGHVNVITGDFLESYTHFALPGPEPLEYVSWYTNRAGWNSNHGARASVCFNEQRKAGWFDEKQDYEAWCFYHEPGRASARLSSNVEMKSVRLKVNFNDKANKGITNLGRGVLSAQTSPRNYRVIGKEKWSDELTMMFGDGTKNIMKKKHDPYNSKWSAQYRLNKTVRPSGNVVAYSGNIALQHPFDGTVYSSLNFLKQEHQNVRKETITTSDARKNTVWYECQLYSKRVAPTSWNEVVLSNIAQITPSHGPQVQYGYWYNKQSNGLLKDPEGYLTTIAYPENRTLKADYIGLYSKWYGLPSGEKLCRHDDRRGRVYELREPVGTTPDLKRSYHFVYALNKDFSGATYVRNALASLSIYRFDQDQRLKSIQQCEGDDRTRSKIKSFTWGKGAHNLGNLLEESFVFTGDNTRFVKQYRYDERGNVLTETHTANFTGTSASQSLCKTYEYSDDGFNLVISETDSDKTIKTAYVPGTNLVKAKFTLGDVFKFRMT